MNRITRCSLVLLLAMAGGCTRWQHTYPLPAPGEAPRTFGAGRVTVADRGTMLVLREVVVTADSVTGWLRGGEEGRQRVAVPRSQVLVFDRAVTDPWRTGGAVLLGVATVYTAAVVYVVSTVYF